ncbi:preprotein translocase subunit SecY [Candidatus Uhrbacteria bacterium]|nr:preprotein translocase subunit SecY [Candidatus Uhrbacteria bacterium]
MWEKLQAMWRVKEVRNGLLFVFVMMLLFRITAHIPLPGIDLDALHRYFQANQVLGLLNLFSGGTVRNFAVVALGVTPYITASIIFQLLAMIIPRLEEIQKDGEAGRQRINQWTRYATVPLAILQSFGLIQIMRQSQFEILTRTDLLHTITLIVTVTAGSVWLMWIGELISEKKVGNGISLLIFAGILAGLPQNLSQLISAYDSSQFLTYAIYAAIAVATVVGVVFVTEGQRNIPVQYARQVRGGTGSVGGVSTHLPLRVNMSGVIPIIFAISILMFPTVVAQFFVYARSAWLANAAQWIIAVMQNQAVYGVLYFVLVLSFTFFYTAIVFQPDQIAENLQKQGGFILGIRPGKPTSEYLTYVINRINLIGALFLGVIAVLPIVAQGAGGNRLLAIGGTSLLIVVSVVIESVKQVESQLSMHDYEAA